MIPKIIHYCWLSNDEYPEKIKKCLASWEKPLKGYEIWLWDFKRLGDACPVWVKEAFENKKYAFAADFVRAYALYHFGGIYLDSDVEVLKPFDEFLQLPYFLGHEPAGTIEAAVMGAEKGHPFFKALLEYYDGRHFVKPDGTMDMETLPNIIGRIVDGRFELVDIDNVDEFDHDPGKLSVLPSDYFSPVVYQSVRLTPRTVAIHHFAGTWCSRKVVLKKTLQRLLGFRVTSAIIGMKRALKKLLKG